MEVFPTKLNYRSDYEKIVSDIEKEYPYLVLDFLKKTYTSFKTGQSPNTDLIWWQVFGGLYNEFIQSSKFILNKPNSRIIRQTKYLKADRINKWTTTRYCCRIYTPICSESNRSMKNLRKGLAD